MKRLIDVVGTICFENQNVVITDPCFLNTEIDFTKKKFKKELGRFFKRLKKSGQYLECDTLVGDWDCLLWKNLSLCDFLNEQSSNDGEVPELDTTAKPSEIVGEFSADAGMVCIVAGDLIGVRNDGASLESPLHCIVRNFTGRASIVTTYDDTLKTDLGVRRHILLESVDGTSYLSLETRDINS